MKGRVIPRIDDRPLTLGERMKLLALRAEYTGPHGSGQNALPRLLDWFALSAFVDRLESKYAAEGAGR
jgi:hypothetical protein